MNTSPTYYMLFEFFNENGSMGKVLIQGYMFIKYLSHIIISIQDSGVKDEYREKYSERIEKVIFSITFSEKHLLEKLFQDEFKSDGITCRLLKEGTFDDEVLPDSILKNIKPDNDKIMSGDEPNLQYLKKYFSDVNDQLVNNREDLIVWNTIHHVFDKEGGTICSELMESPLPDHNINYFVIPSAIPENINGLLDCRDNDTTTLWSANRLTRRGDIGLIYATKSSAKEFKGWIFDGKESEEYFKSTPGTIIGSFRFLHDSIQLHYETDLVSWPINAYIGDVILFKKPIPMDSIIDAPTGKSLSSQMLVGGFMQPRKLARGNIFLHEFRKILFSSEPLLKETYLSYEAYQPEEIPGEDDEDWAEKMGAIQDRVFKCENDVRSYFIDQLLRICLPEEGKIEEEFFTHSKKRYQVDYVIKINDQYLPIEAKYDIDAKEFNQEKVQVYLDISKQRRGMLIDLHGVYEVIKDDFSPKLVFKRKGMGKKEIEKLKKWINDYFKKEKLLS